ncbi:unnamed protein product [Cryptosporidium hominis]|uniref:Uncharacterized protein n=1 Tax=Cryptosporidium hominis TaxID=237895 RepID=A0A0S4TF44_CRYHO|nr:hypothetical protein [Cryptosporidium hominis TU502]OLQ16743.1 hypothetical protein ChTU502y2012_386g0090 [Cryptosporidium hominis]PPA63825.1 hypothetical protein ChUKH1_06220 [Cryptosporidium hominis]PPS93482.1 Uncharacterized protein GY17_00003591 [Cryptosporidium hominis]CUV06132.1 unnamed protein product [Cryptosporidium hominis]|eukprot:PPS93482.1 Uncharacterized protein GY17_00003591 [Cryptosporidium hominis]
MEFAKFVFLCYCILGTNRVFGANDLSNFIESPNILDSRTFGLYEQNKNEYQSTILSSEASSSFINSGLLNSIEDSININQETNERSNFNLTDPPHYDGSSELSENLVTFSNLLISPIMGKSTAILGELSFKYSLDGIRSGIIDSENHYSPANLVNKLFGPNGTKNNAIGLLRYGFLYALINEINNQFQKKIGFKLKLHPKLLIDPLKYDECVNLFTEANIHDTPFLTQKNSKGIFEIICKNVIKNNYFIEMQSWDHHISQIISFIKEKIQSIRRNSDILPKTIQITDLPKVPEIKVSGTEIKIRYLNIVKSIDTIKKKEYPLFNSLIFTKKMAVKISTQYLPNGRELVQKCIEIIKSENPALMREVYQREKIEQICKISMGS